MSTTAFEETGLWPRIRTALGDWLAYDRGIAVVPEAEPRVPGEPVFWAVNRAGGSGSAGRVGRHDFSLRWRLPFAPLDTDPPPAWATSHPPAAPALEGARGQA